MISTIFGLISFIFQTLLIVFLFSAIKRFFFSRGQSFFKVGNDFRLHVTVKKNKFSDKFIIKDSRKRIGDREVGSIYRVGDKAILRKLEINSLNQYGELQEVPKGYVNKQGEVYSVSDVLVGKCDPIGRRSWKQLWLVNTSEIFDENGNEVGRCTESFRLFKPKGDDVSLLARAGATLLLYQPDFSFNDEKYTELSKIKIKDFALVAALIYMLILHPLGSLLFSQHVLFPWLGKGFSYIVSMILIYFLFLGLIMFVLKDLEQDGIRVGRPLFLINRNTGITGWNVVLIITLSAALLFTLFVSNFSLFPIYAVLLIGVLFNMGVTSTNWYIIPPSHSYIKIPEKVEDSGRAGQVYKGTVTKETKTYSWGIKSQKGKVVNVTLDLDFDKGGVDAKRQLNPFYNDNENAVKDLWDSAKKVVANSEDKLTNYLLDKILDKINKTANSENLSNYDTMQLMLSFCQYPNFKWIHDKDCIEINGDPNNNKYDYFRFPLETLYDQRGDCDCTSMLAFALFKRAGIPVVYLLMLSKEDNSKHIAVGVGTLDKEEVPDEESVIQVGNQKYYFCETVGDGYRVGAIPSQYKERKRLMEEEMKNDPSKIIAG